MRGFLAYSLAGRDKGKVYIIIKEEADYIWVTDGDIRPLEKPKKKNKKHIQIIKKTADKQMLANPACINETIKRTIKLYKQSLLCQEK